jgi:Cupin superfamily protein
MRSHPHQVTASEVLARLGPTVLPHFRQPDDMQPRHMTRVFNPGWIGSLPLPIGDHRTPAQTVALADGASFHRTADRHRAADAYQRRPRTRVYEGIEVRSDGWYSLVALQLVRTLRRHVYCSVFESHTHDRRLDPHADEWLGVIVQTHGAKQWRLWPHPDQEPQHLVTEAGDVLTIPAGVRHDVATPASSIHMVFAITTVSIDPTATTAGLAPAAHAGGSGGSSRLGLSAKDRPHPH